MKKLYLKILLIILPIVGFSQRETNHGNIPHIKRSELNSNKLFKINQQITELQYGKINSLLICINEELVFENYYNKYHRDSLNRINSINKSITGLAFGFLYDQNGGFDLNKSISGYFPEYNYLFEHYNLKKTISVEHLLQMSAGFEWNEWSPHYIYNDNSFNRYKNSDSTWIFNTLKLQIKDLPGTTFNYNSGVSQLLAQVIEKESGENLKDFTDENLFQPLGIRNYHWIYDKKNGYPAWGGLRLTSQDMLKIGMLIKNKGKYKDKQLISEEWMNLYTKKHLKTENEFYGYHIWIKEQPTKMFFAAGYGDNYIFVLPEINMTIVVTASNYINYKFQKSIFDLITEILKTHSSYPNI